jgi:hypothetical protein
MSVYRGLSGAVMLTMLTSIAGAQTPSTLTDNGQKPTVTITTEPLAPTNTPSTWNGKQPNSSRGLPTLTPSTPGKLMSNTPPSNPNLLPSETNPPGETISPPNPALLHQHTPLEAWLNYTQPDCCGPTGRHGPVTYDLYFRTGPSFPVGGGIFNNVLSMGWTVGGGGRTLFFNPSGSRAAFVDLSLNFTHNNGHGRSVVPMNFPLNGLFGVNTTVRDFSRWHVGLGGGWEWYMNGPGFVSGTGNWNLSYGFDVGGRYGSSHVTLDIIDPANIFNLGPAANFLRRQDAIGGVYSGLNLNFEMPMHGWTLILGGRTEWALTFTDVLPDYKGNLTDINLLFNIGVRY